MKIVVGSKTYKLEETPHFGDFLARLSRKLGGSPLDGYDISYVDDENQTISVVCEDDFKMALRACTKRPLKFVLKSASESDQSSEDLFRVSTMTCFIGKVEAKMEGMQRGGEISPITAPMFGSYPSFQSDPQNKSKPLGSAGAGSTDSCELSSVPNQQTRTGEAIAYLLNLMVLAKLKGYVLDQFKDICASPAASDLKREQNATKSTIGFDISQISSNRVLVDQDHHPPDEPLASNIFYPDNPKKPQLANVSCGGELTRVGRLDDEQVGVGAGTDDFHLPEHDRPQQQLHGCDRGDRPKVKAAVEVLHQGPTQVPDRQRGFRQGHQRDGQLDHRRAQHDRQDMERGRQDQGGARVRLRRA